MIGLRCVGQKVRMGTAVRMASSKTVGFVGIGHMGSKMAYNISQDCLGADEPVLVYDRDMALVESAVSSSNGMLAAATMEDISSKCDVVFSMLPNDVAVTSVSEELIKNGKDGMTHVSCSTVSPVTSRRLAEEFKAVNKTLVAAPVFARPDGVAKKQCVWMIAGADAGRELASSYLSHSGRVVDYGADTGASNIVKLCGNFMIASTIEAVSESMALAEKHGVDRESVMKLLSTSIFDCLIYKGYGDRVSTRDHRPGGFSLELGFKDVKLVHETAQQADVPMPFCSTLVDRFTSAKARGRGDFDWSAIGLSVAEDAGIDVRVDVKRNREQVDKGETY
jgi:3-hydroxyisobutyrate dehydrogenase-like beta-hydroxyacid dehydrogenase